MKYTICNEIEHSLFFTQDTLRSCGIGYNGTEFFWEEKYNGELIDIDKINKKREEWRARFLQGTQPEQCKKCHLLIDKEWSQDGRFNTILIANRTKCSCNCFYCNFTKDKNYWNNRETYNIYPVIEDLENRQLLTDNLHISVAGGECTEYPNGEFDKIVNFVLNKNCYLSAYSSGINFSDILKKCLAKGHCDICISADAGTKDVYEKIKQVKKFDEVWAHIKEYANAQLPNRVDMGRMIVKYVIVNGINDTKEAFDAFISKCIESNVKHIRIAIEYNWWTENKNLPLPSNLINLIKYIQTFSKDFAVEPVEFAIAAFKIADSQNL